LGPDRGAGLDGGGAALGFYCVEPGGAGALDAGFDTGRLCSLGRGSAWTRADGAGGGRFGGW
jgi:hypothetical protein